MHRREPVLWREEDLYELGAQPIPSDARRRRARGERAYGERGPLLRRLPWIRVGLATAGLVALVAFYAPEGEIPEAEIIGSLLGAPPELLAPPSPWRDLASSDIAVALRDGRFADLPVTHLARAHADGMLQDVVEFGLFASARPHLRVIVERRGAEDLTQRSFYLELVQRAAQAGLSVARAHAEEPLSTREGDVEMAQVRLEGRRARACLAFRARDAGGEIARFGWLCEEPLAPAELACALDALTLRHRETGMSLSPPAARGAQASACPRLPELAAASASLAPEYGASLAPPPRARPMPPPRPADR